MDAAAALSSAILSAIVLSAFFRFEKEPQPVARRFLRMAARILEQSMSEL